MIPNFTEVRISQSRHVSVFYPGVCSYHCICVLIPLAICIEDRQSFLGALLSTKSDIQRSRILLQFCLAPKLPVLQKCVKVA